MRQIKIIHGQIRLIVIYFTLLISACNGQEQTQKSRIESSQVKANTQELIIGYTQSKEQISQVVRKIAYSGQSEPHIPVQTEPPIPEQSEPPLRMI